MVIYGVHLRNRVGPRARQFAEARSAGRLVGLSDSPAACATVGLDVKLTRLGVFAVSAGLAGLGGALYGGEFVTSNDFLLFTSLELFCYS